MRKLPTVFVRTFSPRHEIVSCGPHVTPGCEWVVAGEGRATIKWDGEAYRVLGGKLWRRYDANVRKGRTPPPGAEPCEQAADPVTGHWPHWLLVTLDDPALALARESYAFEVAAFGGPPPDGTYELVGPKVQGNPHGFGSNEFRRHGAALVDVPDRSLDGIRAWLAAHADCEGLVFHHDDGRMAKIKRSDFGMAWPPISPHQDRRVR